MNPSMKKYIPYILLAILAAACNKELDLRPSDTIDPTGAYQNADDINKGLMGAYSALSYYSSIYYTSLVTDETVLPSDNVAGRGAVTRRWQYDGTLLHEAWKDNYIAIDRLNRALYAAGQMTAPSQQDLLKQYKGELLALRAYCHFELIRNFASKYETQAKGVPFMESSVIGAPARLLFAATMEKINVDLTQAKGLIPSEFNDRTRITLPAVSALQARVALYEKNWDNAIKYAAEAIAALPLASKTEFPQLWKDKSTAEIFWKLKRVSGDEEIGGLYTDTGYLDNPEGTMVYYAASYKLTNEFDQANDIRFSSYIDINARRKNDGKAPNVVVKYMSSNGSNLVDIKLLRTGEMYLIRAEAYAEKNNLAEAAKDLNDLRAARITAYAPQQFADKDALIDAIYTERFKELAFEGHRHFDLRRRNRPILREGRDTINTLGAVLLRPDMPQYVFPIPNSELRVNPNMQQNDGY
ncbi:MAG: RagB/SusD family nutrient uptake outer membrane protein [Candidatus Nephrothrix sp. EaCA]|nr:MAG: RagB/SusD family nutrient uptake outer membrane protein [Candidatus Nephrothrix sp. EaCA]